MNTFSAASPAQMSCGPSCIKQIGAMAAEYGRNVYVLLYDGAGAQELREQVGALLVSEDVQFTINQSIRSEPTIEDADAVARECRELGCDVVVSIGGGSVIDTGKIVAFLARNPGSCREYQMGERHITEPVVPHIAVPTTSGTGAEATKVAVLSNKQEGFKKSIVHPRIVPNAVLLDPNLLVSLPPALTALTGIDALSHAAESYVSLNANALTEACGAKAIELIGKNLCRAVKDGSCIEARGNMAIASYMAGLSLNAGVGAAHILAQPLGAALGVSHSGAIAAVLPGVFDANCFHSPEKYASMALALGADTHGMQTEEAARLCGPALRRLYVEAGVSAKLSDCGMKTSDIPTVLEIVSRSTSHIKSNPRPVDDDVLIEILKASL